jgi:hypothetical protein
MFKLICKRQLLGHKNQVKGNKSGIRHALKVGCDTKSWKLLLKQGLLAKL